MPVTLNVVLTMPVNGCWNNVRPSGVNNIVMRSADNVAVRIPHDVIVMVHVAANDASVQMRVVAYADVNTVSQVRAVANV